MAHMVYSDPTYLHDGPCTTILSDARSAKLSSSALHFLNATLDELLQVITHASLLSFSSPLTSSTPSPSASPSIAYSTSSLFNPNEVLSIDRFKCALQRVAGPHLGKECILESEIAIRELLRRGGSGLKRDPALQQSKPSAGNPVSQTNGESIEVARQSEEIFKGLREWVMRISGLGALCPHSGPANLTTHLSELSAHRNPPSPSSPHISFLLALYVERSLTTLATHLLQSISSVMSNSSHSDIAIAHDLEVAFGEDESIWTWFQGMRVRGAIEEEGRMYQERLRSPTMGSSFALQQQQSRNGGNRRLGSFSNGINSRTSLDSHNSSGKTGGPPLHYRKNSLALSVVPSMNSSRSDDPFDQLLQSGETMKLSMTPDRLQLMEKAERARKASALNLRSSSVSPIAAPVTTVDSSVPLAPPIVQPNSSMRRKLQARGPQQKDLFNEEDEDSADPDLDANPKRGGTKQSLMDLLNSPPPWSGSGFEPPARGGRDSASPTSTDMRSQGSQSTVASGMTGATSQSSGGEEAYLNRNPDKKQRALKAKDEKRDLASERQVNTDLMNFFRNSPPATSPVIDQSSLSPPNGAPASPPLGGKRSKGGLRGFMSKVTGNSSQRRSSDDRSAPPAVPTPPFALPMDPPPPPAARSSFSSSRPPRMRSVSAQSNKSLGASSQGTTTYALPPGLGDTPEKEKERKRARKRTVSGEVAKLQLAPPRPHSPPLIAHTDQPPISILRTKSTSTSSSSPVPLPSSILESRPSIVRPQRSSSLKRRVRSRESSAATTSSVPPPTVIMPSGPVISDLDSIASSTSRSQGHSSLDDREEATTETEREDTIAPSRSQSDGSLTPQPLKLRQLLLVDSRRNSSGTTAVQPELSPVNESTASSSPSQFRQASPAPLTLANGSDEFIKTSELVKALEGLRMDMTGAKTRQDCISLIDELLASYAAAETASSGGMEEEGIEGRMVEYYLS